MIKNNNKIIKYKNINIDLNSGVQYTVKTYKEIFKYKSNADFTTSILDRIFIRTMVFDIQHIGDYLLFGESEKLTCFNLKQEKPCTKIIKYEPYIKNVNPDG